MPDRKSYESSALSRHSESCHRISFVKCCSEMSRVKTSIYLIKLSSYRWIVTSYEQCGGFPLPSMKPFPRSWEISLYKIVQFLTWFLCIVVSEDSVICCFLILTLLMILWKLQTVSLQIHPIEEEAGNLAEEESGNVALEEVGNLTEEESGSRIMKKNIKERCFTRFQTINLSNVKGLQLSTYCPLVNLKVRANIKWSICSLKLGTSYCNTFPTFIQ